MMPFTHKILKDWAGERTFLDGQALFDRGLVTEASYEPPVLKGEITLGSRTICTSAKVLPDSTCENLCPCRDSRERGIVCSHVIAVGLALIRRASSPDRERKHFEETRRAERLGRIDEAQYLQRVEEGTEGAYYPRLRLELARDWKEQALAGHIPLLCAADIRGRMFPLDEIPRDWPLAFTKGDEAVLFVLEDIAEGPARGRMDLSIPDFINVVELCVGKPLSEEGLIEPIVVNAARMSTVLKVDLDRETGELILLAHTELPFSKPGEFPLYLLSGKTGWVYQSGHLWPMEHILPDAFRAVYREPVVISRPAVPRFLQMELPVLSQFVRVESEVSTDLLTIEPEQPGFRLLVRGSPASLAAVLYADYGDLALIASKNDPRAQFAHPDPADLLRYLVRHPEAESRALERLGRFGLVGEAGDSLADIKGCREVLNFMGSGIPALRRLGWKVALEGKIEPFAEQADYAAPVVRITDSPGGDWFEVSFDFDDGKSGSLSPAEIQRALLKGDSYVEVGERPILLDSAAIRAMTDIFSDCASGEGSKPGSFRLNRIYASYVRSSLDALDGVDVESSPSWQRSALRQNRVASLDLVPLGDPLDSILRPYQKDGVNWLRFLEANTFAGILADEMGLGKTLQTLAWLQLARHHEHARGRPSLIVCPTSLVENWAEEAGRFVPRLKVLTLTGGDRHEKWDQVASSDLVITSYALMRRDIEQYVAVQFAVAALDEAQHIKNRSTQNAMAAKRLKAVHRLVLTGTPIENSVSDLWSIMDFLMPDYLGSHEHFRHHYEVPIAEGESEGENAQAKLRRKLHPFLLRRLKKDVAKDLPPKIERVAFCALTADQQRVYKALLESSRREIGDLVARHGFNKARMDILKLLLRLRQTCCHLELLKLPDLDSKYPSGKMDLFFELMDEAFDAGHRVLVFSQFVSMLTILRREFEQRGNAYCYLDGSTRDRIAVVREFNSNRAIPAFLISLKAGGTGLNLTGADMVVHFDPWWNPAVENQATDRAHRIGQQKTVYSIKLISRDTVEERVLEMQRRKKRVIDATLDSDEQVMNKMTWEDIQELLAM